MLDQGPCDSSGLAEKISLLETTSGASSSQRGGPWELLVDLERAVLEKLRRQRCGIRDRHDLIKWTALAATGIAAVMPGLRRKTTVLGTGIAVAAGYIRVAEGRSRTRGEMNQFFERVAERPDYDRLTVSV